MAFDFNKAADKAHRWFKANRQPAIIIGMIILAIFVSQCSQ